MTVSFFSPAKLNLFLHIVGRRGDGYHELQSVFQFLAYGDRVTFAPDNSGVIRREDSGTHYKDDLILRAAQALKPYAKPDAGVAIWLDKRIPEGGGLGGGSSNAATTLVALNQLWNLGMSREKLMEIGLSLGADVPIFVHGKAAWAEGVGEQLTTCEPPEDWFLVLTPPVQVPTAEIFAAKELTRDTRRMKICALSDVMLTQDTHNDFTKVVCARYPEVAAVIAWLTAHAPTRLTGSGASVFGRFKSQAEAQAVLAEVPTTWQAFVAHGVNRSPLYRGANATDDRQVL